MSSTAGVWGPRRGKVVETDIPARMDRLPWSRWILDVSAEQRQLDDVAEPLTAAT